MHALHIHPLVTRTQAWRRAVYHLAALNEGMVTNQAGNRGNTSHHTVHTHHSSKLTHTTLAIRTEHDILIAQLGNTT